MAAVLVDASAHPLVRVVFPSAVTNEEYAAVFDRYVEIAKRPGRIAYEIDMRQLNPLFTPASVRRNAAEVFARHREVLLRTTLCEARLLSNPLVQGVLTAFDWLTGNKWPCANFTSQVEMDAWLKRQLDDEAKRSAFRASVA
jgi:hypothetical protein